MLVLPSFIACMQLEVVARYAGYIMSIIALLAVIAKVLAGYRQIKTGMLCQLRSDMLSIYYRNLESGTIRQYELENFLLMYQAYTAMHGNSFIHEIYEVVTSWKIIT